MITLPERERQYVLNSYSRVAHKFSGTRYKVWPCVQKFIDAISENETIIELGCGNGKNLVRHNMVGVDNCPELMSIAHHRGCAVILSDMTAVPLPDNSFDHAMSIAAVHHLSTPERRSQAIIELVRLVRPGGKILIVVWFEGRPDQRSFREPCQTGDVEIDFQGVTRFYHLFAPGELEQLVYDTVGPLVTVEQSYPEEGNYILVLHKRKTTT